MTFFSFKKLIYLLPTAVLLAVISSHAAPATVNLSAVGNGTANANSGTNAVWVGTATFTTSAGTARNLTSVTITASDGAGAIDEADDLSLVRAYIETVNSPADSSANQYGATGVFSGNTSGTLTFTETQTIDQTYYIHFYANVGRNIAHNGNLKLSVGFTSNNKGTGDPTVNSTGTTFSDVSAPLVSIYNPADGASGVGLTDDFILTFDEPVNKGTGNILIIATAGPTTLETVDVTSGNVTGQGTATITINPAASLVGVTAYHITIASTCFKDAQNNAYAGISDATTWNFGSAGTEDYSLWSYSKRWLLNTSATGANVSGNVLNFPILVRLDNSNFDFSEALANGQDIRFAKSNGAHLRYEIERWDSSNDTAALWVRHDTVYGNNSSQYINMYWGKTGSADSSSPGNVFKTTENFVGVWHLNNLTNSTSTAGLTAVQNGGGPAATTSGMITGAYDWDGTDDYLTVADNAVLDMGNDFAVFFWLKYEGGFAHNWNRIASRKNAWNDATGWEIALQQNDDDALQVGKGGASQHIPHNIISNWSASAWHHICVVHNGTADTVYVNGAAAANAAALTAISDNNNALAFGELSNGSGDNWNGKMDEIWLYDAVPTASFVKLAYENQKAAQTLVERPSYYWTGSGPDNNWSTAGNWSTGIVPGINDKAVFDSRTNKTCLLDIDDTVSSIDLESGYIGTFNFGSKTLTLRGTGDFCSGGSFTAGTGAIRFISTVVCSLLKNTTSEWPDVYIKSSADVILGGAGFTATDFTIESGTLDLGSGLAHSGTLTMTNGGIDFGTSSFTVSSGNVDFSTATFDSVVAGNGTLILSSGSAQTVTARASDTLPTISHSGSGTLTLATNPFKCNGFSNTGGPINFASVDMTTVGSFNIISGGPSTTSNLGGIRITVGGNATMTGTVGNLLNLNPSTWYIDVTGSLFCDYCNLNNSNASGGAQGEATNSTDGGANTNWNFAAEDYGTWSTTKNLYINTASDGANVSGQVSFFPLFIRFTSSNFTFSESKDLGADLRFSKPNGAHLKYHVERWDKAASLGEVWVLVDTVWGNNKTQYIKMHWGNGGATDKSDSNGVFSSSRSWVGAWFLDENPNGDPANAVFNRVSNSLHGTPIGAMTTADLVAGTIYNSLELDGANDAVTVTDAAALDITSALTLTTWFKINTIANWSRIVSKSHTSDVVPYTMYGLHLNGSNNLRSEMSDGLAQFTVDGTTTLNTTNWYHGSFTFDGSNMRLYLNGVQEKAVPHTGSIDQNNVNLAFGRAAGCGCNYFNGRIDQVQISNVARSADWVKLEYECQKAGAAFIYSSNSPIVTGLSSSGNVSASQIDVDSVKVQYEVQDPNQSTVIITGIYKPNGGAWAPMTDTAGHIGPGVSSTDGTADLNFRWRARSDIGSDEDNYYVAVIATDADSNKDTTYSQLFTLDTQNPTLGGSLTAPNTSSNWVELGWTAGSDANFNHYEIWYGTNQSDVQNRTGTAVEWDQDDHAALINASQDSTKISSLSTNTTYYFKIWAIDSIGNSATLTDLTQATDNMVAPVWTATGLGAINGGAIGTSAIYVGTDASQLYSIKLTDGSVNWGYNTFSYGLCNPPTYIYTGTSYKVFATAGNYLIGRQDDGTSSSQIFAPINLGSAAGVPYTAPDQTNLFVTYTNKIDKKSITTGASDAGNGWPITKTGVSTTADIAIFNDEVYYVVGNDVCKADVADGTPEACYTVGTTTSLPLLISGSTLYVTPDNNTILALNTSDMSAKWTPATLTLQGTNSGAPFAVDNAAVYAAVGTKVERVLDNGAASAATSDWNRDVTATVSSGPIFSGNAVYFGRNTNNLYAVYATGASEGQDITNWPYTAATGNATSGPWLDPGNSRVIFGTEGGELISFTQE